MLKKFLLNSLSSFVGAWLALALFGVAAVATLVALIGSIGDSQPMSVSKHSILHIMLAGSIEEAEKAEDLDYFELIQGNLERPQTLDVLVASIKEAAANKNIDAIYLECGGVSASPATLNALRSQLAEFKKSGKKIYAYGDTYSMGDYFVATVADSLYMNPEGTVALQGVGGTSFYMKDFFDKIGVSFEVVKVGTFKSAVEPYISNEMSEPARAQLDTLYGGIWKYIRDDIASRRGISAARIDTLINRDYLFLQDAKWVKSHKIVDRLIYERELKPLLAKVIGVDKPEKLNLVSPDLLASQTPWGVEYGSKKQIAVLYATGEIMENNPSGIDCFTLVPQIVKLADDENVKGLVLRVNSPGGSVFGSSQIGEALDYFQSKGKTLAVSMGDYAASGGYWISCRANCIFADPLTITGSIGIYGLLPNIEGLSQKIGIHPQTVTTNPGANFPGLFYAMTPAQHDAMQNYVERGYDSFVKRVASGRHLSEARVRQIAEGRVYSAMDAKKLKLVDNLGSLDDAIVWTAKKAGVENDYDVAVYPKLSTGFMDIIATASAQNQEFSQFCRRISGVTTDEVVIRMAYKFVHRKPLQALAPQLIIRL
ncbi:MAG: signal peptide peptidase SppA [Clostridium sp.]|nr:signal peptide peptidase SppA [Clostridium sp.]MCM1475924.1 signal peptide peptidase SppA [Muribaculaceae bacterium]